MNEAINAYQEGNLRPAGSVEEQRITVSPEFRELERARSLACHDEATALYHAREEVREEVARKMKGMGFSDTKFYKKS